MIPAVSSRSPESYDAARHAAGLVERVDDARIVVSGADRATYLHGLFTNDITSLQAGHGCYAAYLTPQGRMIADLRVYELGDVMLLVVHREVLATVMAKLDQFIFTEDVHLGDVTPSFGAVAVVGPKAAAIVAGAMTIPDEILAALPAHGNLRATFNGQPAIVLRVSDTGEPGFDVLVEATQLGAFRDAARRAGAMPIDAHTAEALRIEGGVPRFHRDMDEDTIPLEAGIEARAISLTKGCYVGQEVIIRVLHRGHGRVAKKLVGLMLEGESVPEDRAAVHADNREIGAVTSAVWSPSLQRPIALAYVHRDFLAPGTRVMVNGSPAEVVALPFVSRGDVEHGGTV